MRGPEGSNRLPSRHSAAKMFPHSNGRRASDSRRTLPFLKLIFGVPGLDYAPARQGNRGLSVEMLFEPLPKEASCLGRREIIRPSSFVFGDADGLAMGRRFPCSR